jgi:dynein heavy chain, axonemal
VLKKQNEDLERI